MNGTTWRWMTHGLAAAGSLALAVMLGAGGRFEEPAQPQTPADMQAAMAGYMKSIKPNERHKYLEQLAGDWETTMQVFTASGAKPIETKGTSKNEMIHGGRFLKMDTTGALKMPGPDGKTTEVPMVGLGLMGFDNNRKLYTFMWTDTLNTGMLLAKGNLSQDGEAMTLFGEMDEPLTGEMGKPVRYVTRIIDKDHYTFEISEVIYGEPFKVVQIDYSRKK